VFSTIANNFTESIVLEGAMFSYKIHLSNQISGLYDMRDAVNIPKVDSYWGVFMD
jgi:hypothetical protein